MYVPSKMSIYDAYQITNTGFFLYQNLLFWIKLRMSCHLEIRRLVRSLIHTKTEKEKQPMFAALKT